VVAREFAEARVDAVVASSGALVIHAGREFPGEPIILGRYVQAKFATAISRGMPSTHHWPEGEGAFVAYGPRASSAARIPALCLVQQPAKIELTVNFRRAARIMVSLAISCASTS